MTLCFGTRGETYLATGGYKTITTVLSGNDRVDSGSFSSRCTFRRTHERRPYSAALYPTSFTLDSFPSEFTSSETSERLEVGVAPRALRLAGMFSRRKKDVQDTHRLGVERGGGVMMTPPLQCVARFDGEIFGLDREVTRRVGCGSPCLSNYPLFLAQSGEQLVLPMYWRGTSLSISRVFVPKYFPRQSVVVDVEGVAFRPRILVVGRGLVAGCTRIFASQNIYEK